MSDDIDMDELRRRVAKNRERHAADLERLERQRAVKDEAESMDEVTTPAVAAAALRSLGVPEGIAPAPLLDTGCKVCDRMFEVADAPWWPVEYGNLCPDHMAAVTLAHAERILRADPPRGIPKSIYLPSRTSM